MSRQVKELVFSHKKRHFCVTWISLKVSLSKAVEEVEKTLVNVKLVVFQEKVKGDRRNVFAKAIEQDQIKNICIFDIEVLNRGLEIPQAVGFHSMTEMCI